MIERVGILLAHSRGSGEMADTQVLGTCVFGRVGSSPTSRTRFKYALKMEAGHVR